MNKLKYLLLLLIVGVTACEVVRVVEPPVQTDKNPVEVNDVGFSLLASNVSPTTISIRTSWKKPISDGKGDPEYYLHTMTANKTVSGTLPNRKRVNGLIDTVVIGRPAVTDTLILTSRVWSVRRLLESTTPATAQLVIRTADSPPPPPDSIRVDTIVLAPIIGGAIKVNDFFSEVPADSNTMKKSLYSLFIREEDGSTTFFDKNTTYITLVKK
jgi:hypothetical protein